MKLISLCFILSTISHASASWSQIGQWSVEQSITVNSTASKIYQQFTDYESWDQWDSALLKAEIGKRKSNSLEGAEGTLYMRGGQRYKFTVAGLTNSHFGYVTKHVGCKLDWYWDLTGGVSAYKKSPILVRGGVKAKGWLCLPYRWSIRTKVEAGFASSLVKLKSRVELAK